MSALKIIGVLALLGILSALFLVFLAPLTVISLIFGFVDLCSKKISGNEEMKKVVEEEKKKIGIPDSVSVAIRNTPKYDFSIFGGYGGKACCGFEKNKYLINLGYATNRETIAHEIFHVYRYLAIKGEEDVYFYDEILAIIYGLFHLNLGLKKI